MNEPETPDAGPDGRPDPARYTPKPPLWMPASENPLSRLGIAAGSVLVLLALGLLAVVLENRFFCIPLGQVRVTVNRLQSGNPVDEEPPVFRYAVQLPDGSLRPFAANRIFRPGDKLLVTATRGRITGRTWLGGPYQFAPESGDSR